MPPRWTPAELALLRVALGRSYLDITSEVPGAGPVPVIVCLYCGRASANRHDIEQRYCGSCHCFHEDEGVSVREATAALLDAAQQRVRAGRYYGLAPDGMQALELPDSVVPDVVVARRVADFPRQRVPRGGSVVNCAGCGAPVVTNLEKFPEVPRRCMQCQQIHPDPIPDAS